MDEQHEKNMLKLNELCKGFDWFYHFSDDHSVYMRGEAAKAELNAIAEKCGRDGARLIAAYRDINFGPHTGFTYHYPEDVE